MIQRLSDELESEAWVAFRSLLVDAEQVLGPRDDRFSVVDIVQSDTGPNMKLDGDEITLIVGPYVQVYPPNLISNIAHETVHVLNPTTGYASWLEEGVAVHFELGTIERRFDGAVRRRLMDCLPGSYANAFDDYEKLLEYDCHAGRSVRSVAGLSGVSRSQLRKLFPGVSRRLISKFVTRRQMR